MTRSALLVMAMAATTALAAEPDARASSRAVKDLGAFLKKPDGALAEQAFASVALTRRDAGKALDLLWKARRDGLRASRKAEMDAKRIELDGRELRFDFSRHGKRPRRGWSLYISLHGGGNTSAGANDRQWENQKKLYRPKEGYYVAPRAPTNTWNLWHESHIDPLFDRLIENFVVLADVDPNRVYVMGYSAGGDGVYQLAPRMADRWAAVAMMAGHPNETSPLGLRNVPFTLHMGGNDSAYRRNEVAREFGERLAKLREADPGGYVNEVRIHEGLGHWMQLRDAVALDWMARFTRDPVPERVVWKQDDVVHARFYWLAVERESARKGAEIIATRDDQTIRIERAEVGELTLLLDDRMLDLDEEVIVVGAESSPERELFRGSVERTIANLARTLEERGDRELAFSASVKVEMR